MPTGEAAHPAVTSMGTRCKQCPIVLVSPSGVGVVVELWALRPVIMRAGQSSCGLLALPQEDLPA